jgi:hypothetical protein
MYSNGAGVYNKYDTLASADDFTALFETLERHKDSTGCSAVFTAMSLVANPDFEKIRRSDFSEYFYEPLTATLSRYYTTFPVINCWKEGIEKKLFLPQFHGREHLNVSAWMSALQQNDEETHLAFKEGCWGFNKKNQNKVEYQAAFDLERPEELVLQAVIIREGLGLFEKIFGYKATFFVPPNGSINNNLEEVTLENGIKYISTSKMQREALGNGKTRIRLHYVGQRNKWNQIYLTRNCFFEPSHSGRDWVASCLNEIESAFSFSKPAVVSTHRVNYIGTLHEENRTRGLTQLKLLLTSILKKWPDVHFITSQELGDLIGSE